MWYEAERCTNCKYIKDSLSLKLVCPNCGAIYRCFSDWESIAVRYEWTPTWTNPFKCKRIVKGEEDESR